MLHGHGMNNHGFQLICIYIAGDKISMKFYDSPIILKCFYKLLFLQNKMADLSHLPLQRLFICMSAVCCSFFTF